MWTWLYWLSPMLAKNIIGSPSFLYFGKVLHCGYKKLEKNGNFRLKGTFENNCLKNEKRCQTFLSQNFEKRKEKKSLE
jgi:hypothetical protein